jgi:DivIVA domain-containing protein
MIDLTPLDVRNKRGDFKKILRGYDPQEVDVFLELVAERMEGLVREVLQLRERSETLAGQVDSQSGRERAVQEALVTAQELRSEIRDQAHREAALLVEEAQAEGRRQRAEAEAEVRMMLRDAERKLEQGKDALEEMERRRARFLKAFRQLLEREMDVVEVEEGRAPLEDRPIDLDLRGPRHAADASDFGANGDVQPPMDAPIDELAARYDTAEADDARERDLFTAPESE